jgi:hypothetical protein
MDSARDGPGGSISKTGSCALCSPTGTSRARSIAHAQQRDRLAEASGFISPGGADGPATKEQ